MAGIQGGHVEYAFPGDVLTFTVAAGQSVSGGQLVALTANAMEVQHAGVDSEKCVGVALHDAAAGEKVTVASSGVYRLKANGAVGVGDYVDCAAVGDVKTMAASGGSYVQTEANNFRQVIGLALEAISNGQRGRVMLKMR